MALAITRRERRIVVGAALVLLGFAVVVVSQRGDDAGQSAGGQDASAREPGIAVESELPTQPFELLDGTSATFADFEGDPLVINFWASWCPACVAELPEMQTVHEQRGDEVTFLGIANADARAAALDLADQVGLTYTLADDPEGALFLEFGLIAMPSTLFVSPDGAIVEVFGGQLDESALNERIDQLIAAS